MACAYFRLIGRSPNSQGRELLFLLEREILVCVSNESLKEELVPEANERLGLGHDLESGCAGPLFGFAPPQSRDESTR